MMSDAVGIFGEVLFDTFPGGERVLGGAPFNVAWHVQALGGCPRFLSRIGADSAGRQIQAAMRMWGMTADGLQVDSLHPTGTVAVSFVDDEPRYAILDGQAYDFIERDAIAKAKDCRLLYHGSLAVRNPVSAATLAALKRQHCGWVFMDVNLREPWWQAARVAELMREADWLKLNDEELRLLVPEQSSITARMESLLQRYALRGVVATRGAEGAVALTADGEWIEVRPTPNTAVVDTVGAGDAFAAVLLLGLQRDWSLVVTMQRAQMFASALVGCRGATVADSAFYQPFVTAWCKNE